MTTRISATIAALMLSSASIAHAAPATRPADGAVATETAVLEVRDITLRGGPGCRVAFAYAGNVPEDLFWAGERCGAVSAASVDRDRLAAMGNWDRLDDHAKERISNGPGGVVLRVEGRFSASIYPIDYNNLTYEVPVSD